LGLKGNPISSPPAQYLQAGREAVLNYWQQLDKLAAQKQRLRVVNETRLIIIGNSNVGKSTLSYLLQKGEFPPADLSSTHGLEFSVWRPGWKINDAELTVNIIDFGGQEYYHDTHHLFFTDKAAFLLLWDPNSNKNAKIQTRVGDRDRTEMIQHFGVEYWLNAIEIYGSTSYDTTIYQAVSKEYHEQLLSGEPMREEQEKIPIEEDPRFEAMDARIFSHAPVLLVQTFMDKYGKTFLNMKDLQARYPRLEDAVSVSMDRTRGAARGIDLLRGKIRDLYENMQEITSQTYDVAWLTIRSYIEKEEKDSYHIMTIAAFRDYFLEHADHGMEYTEADTRTLCITLNHWGVVLYRYEMEELRDIVIINPQYFTTQINRLLTEKLRERNGAISRHEVPEILNMDAARANTFIRVLKSFKILFELPRAKEEDEPHYISPMYLQEKPAYVDLFLSQFVAYYKIRYDGYFHKGILLDCFRELGQELLHEKGVYFYWQWGLVLRREGRIICIEFDDTRLDQVVIKMIRHNKESLGKEEFLRDVFIAFEKINRKYKVDIELSCNGSDFVSQQLLLDKMNTGLNKFDLDGKRWDTRDFYFLLHPDEIASPYKRIFISYSRADRRSVDRLTAHLKLYENAGICTYWFDGLLAERHEWDEQIKTEMEKANILIMLLSPDYFGANYIVKEEMPEGTRQVFWVLLRPCNYEAFVNVAAHTVYPLKETDSQSEKASQRAISEYEDQDRQWERLLKMILEEM
jgi:GTPase SAR1 family protein